MCPARPAGTTTVETADILVSAAFSTPSDVGAALEVAMGATSGHIVVTRLAPGDYPARANTLTNLDGTAYTIGGTLASGFVLRITFSGATVTGNMPQVRAWVVLTSPCALV